MTGCYLTLKSIAYVCICVDGTLTRAVRSWLSPRINGFRLWLLDMGFVVDEVVLVQVFPPC
jgi:hypothetical protein